MHEIRGVQPLAHELHPALTGLLSGPRKTPKYDI